MLEENREYELFEKYVDTVTKRILSPKKKSEIHDELFSHFIEEYERYTALGLDHDNAQEKIIDAMGDKDELSKQFGEIHSIYSVDYMRSSLSYIIGGLIFTTFHVNLFFEGFSSITDFFGEALLIFGLFLLRKTDKKLNTALVLQIITKVFSLIVNIITMNMADPREFFELCGIYGAIPLQIITLGFLFAGIDSLCNTLEAENLAKPKMFLSFISYVIFNLLAVVSYGYESPELAIIASLLIIIPLWQLRNAKKVLANEDEEFELQQTLNSAEKGAYWAIILMLITVPVISMLVISLSEPEVAPYVQNDISAETVSVQNARENMLKLGFPEEYLKDLPNSEILEYEKAIDMYTDGEQDLKCMRSFGIVECEFKEQQFTFIFPDGDFRNIMRVELPDDKRPKMRMGLYLDYKNYNLVCSRNDKEFQIALSDYRGKTVASTPIFEYSADYDFYTGGFEFKFPKKAKNCRAYISKSVAASHPSQTSWLYTSGGFIFEKIPLSTNHRSINSLAIERFKEQTYTSNYAVGFHQLGHEIYYEPETVETE